MGSGHSKRGYPIHERINTQTEPGKSAKKATIALYDTPFKDRRQTRETGRNKQKKIYRHLGLDGVLVACTQGIRQVVLNRHAILVALLDLGLANTLLGLF